MSAVALFGLTVYAYFNFIFLYFVYWAFPGDFFQGSFLEDVFGRSVDSDPLAGVNTARALVSNLAWLVLFVVQHSVMARPAFKSWFSAHFPAAAERSAFVLAASLILHGMMATWWTVDATVFDLGEWAQTAAAVVYVLGFVVLLASTFMINHFELFGLKQSAGIDFGPHNNEGLVTRGFYAYVRHPIMTGFQIIMLGSVLSGLGGEVHLMRFVLALGVIGYSVLGPLVFEERDLSAALDEYEAYKAQVPAFFPTGKKYVKGEKGVPLA